MWRLTFNLHNAFPVLDWTASDLDTLFTIRIKIIKDFLPKSRIKKHFLHQQ